MSDLRNIDIKKLSDAELKFLQHRVNTEVERRRKMRGEILQTYAPEHTYRLLPNGSLVQVRKQEETYPYVCSPRIVSCINAEETKVPENSFIGN